MKYFAIAAGGSIGALFRYFVAVYVHKFVKPDFPFGTLTANILGCFLIGFFFHLSTMKIMSPNFRLFIMVGLLGAFTTFSTFSLETLSLIKSGQTLYAGMNILLSVVVGLIAVMIGIKLCQFVVG